MSNWKNELAQWVVFGLFAAALFGYLAFSGVISGG